MRTLPPRGIALRRGITLLEMTVVICVLVTLVGITFVAAEAWKKGTERSGCIMTMYNMQLSVRSYQNFSGRTPGSRPIVAYGTYDIARHLLENGYIGQDLYDAAAGEKLCKGGGTYDRAEADIFPQAGTLYMECSLASTDSHAPQGSGSW